MALFPLLPGPQASPEFVIFCFRKRGDHILGWYLAHKFPIFCFKVCVECELREHMQTVFRSIILGRRFSSSWHIMATCWPGHTILDFKISRR